MRQSGNTQGPVRPDRLSGLQNKRIVDMMNERKYILAAAALLSLSLLSCKKVSPSAIEEVKENVQTPVETVIEQDTGSPIRIASVMDGDNATKGLHQTTNESLIAGDKFGLFAWWNRREVPFDGILTGYEWLKNAQVSYVETTGGRARWRCEPHAYWPLGCNLSFFAYAPYMNCSGPTLVLPNGEVSTMPRGTFTQKTDPAQQIDFCMSTPVMDRSKSDGDVPITFWHALTRVLFYVNLNAASSDSGRLYPDDDHQYRVKSIVLEGIVNSNKFTFSGRNTVTWDELRRADLTPRSQSYSLSIAAGTLDPAPTPFEWDMESYTGLNRYKCVNGAAAGQLYLLPQPMTTKAKVTMVVSKGYWSGGVWTQTEDLPAFTINLPTETVWKSGQTAAYYVSLDITQWEDIEFSVTLLPWGSATDSTTFPV